MNQIKELLEKDKAISNKITCAKKLYYNEINNKLGPNLNLLQTISSNYTSIIDVLQIFKSNEQLNEYIKYLDELENNKYIDFLQEIVNRSEDYSFAKPFVESIENLNVSTNFQVWDRGSPDDKTEFTVNLNCNSIDLMLEYIYDPDGELQQYHLYLGSCDVKGGRHNDANQDLEDYKQELIEIMDEYNLPIEKINEFNKIIIQWIIVCGDDLDIFDDIIGDFNFE